MIQRELSYDAEAVRWNQGVFRETNVPIEDLMDAIGNYDFAVFVLLPEDLTNIGGQETLAIRDNVIFEMGLFLGKLGRKDVFFIAPADPVEIKSRLPSDLSGITPAKYDPTVSYLQAAVGTALFQLKEAIRDHQVRSSSTKTDQNLRDIKVEEQQTLINRLVETSMSNSAFRHLAGIYLLKTYLYQQDEKVGELFRRQLYYLKDRGFIEPEELEFDEGLDGTNIAELARPTEIGRLISN